MLILGSKDVNIYAFRILFGTFKAIKGIHYKTRFAHSSWRNQHSIPSILQICNEFFRFFRTVTEVVRTNVTLINKGISRS